MLAMTVRPPWSWAIAEAQALTAIGANPKPVENRGRKVADKHIGQQIAIHAGRTWCKTGERDSRIHRVWTAFARAIRPAAPNPLLAEIGDLRTGVVGRLQPGLWIETGAVVAVATFADCHQADQTAAYATCCWPWGDREYQTAAGPVPAQHLVLTDVRRLPTPVPCRGEVRVPWQLPADVVEQVEKQLAKAGAR